MFKLGNEHNRSMSAKIHWRDPLCVKTSFWRSSAVFFGACGSFAGFGGFQTEFGRVFYYGNTAKLAENPATIYTVVNCEVVQQKANKVRRRHCMYYVWRTPAVAPFFIPQKNGLARIFAHRNISCSHDEIHVLFSRERIFSCFLLAVVLFTAPLSCCPPRNGRSAYFVAIIRTEPRSFKPNTWTTVFCSKFSFQTGLECLTAKCGHVDG